MARVINFLGDRLPTPFKSGFEYSLRLQIITDTDNKVKLCVVMDLLAKTIIMPPKIIFNNEYLPRNLNLGHFTLKLLSFTVTQNFLAKQQPPITPI